MTVHQRESYPVYCVCSAGTKRWFWAAWESCRDTFDGKHAKGCGHEADRALAERKAAEVAGPGAKAYPAGYAAHYKRQLSVQARMAKPAKGSKDATRLEFLYSVERDYDEYDHRHYISVTKFRIVKTTARRIYVDRDPFDEDRWARMQSEGREESWYDHDVRTMVVDRATLERDGRHRNPRRSWSYPWLYPSEEAGRRDIDARAIDGFAWADRLGISHPCTTEAVKDAYRRLAKESHPDRGGDPAAFVELERAYREALTYCSRGVAAGQ